MSATSNPLTIGGAARLAGVGVETIRFYERCGLIERPQKPSSAPTRRYPLDTVDRIRFIKNAQQLGFSLREVGELLALRADADADCAAVREKAQLKLRAVRQKIEQLSRVAEALQELIDDCPRCGALAACAIMGALADASLHGDYRARAESSSCTAAHAGDGKQRGPSG